MLLTWLVRADIYAVCVCCGSPTLRDQLEARLQACCTAEELASRPRTQSSAKREAQAEDDATVDRYAKLGQNSLSDELSTIQMETQQLRVELGI